MTGTTIRAAAALALLAAVSATPRAQAADDGVEKAKPPTLRLVAGRTYAFRYVEDVTLRVPTQTIRLQNLDFAAGDTGATGAEVGRRAVWEVGLKLVEVRPDESIVATLLPVRVSGESTAGGGTPPPDVNVEPMPGMKFDSDDVGAPIASSEIVGRAIVVRLSPAARVLEATPAPLAPSADGAPARVDRVTSAAAFEFAQRFFQELPTTQASVKATWESRRRLAPDLGWPLGRRQDLGEIVESAVIDGFPQGAYVAKLASTTAASAAAPTPPAAFDSKSSASPWRTQVLSRTLVGSVVIDRATGLARTRTTSIRVAARRGPFTIPARTVVVEPGRARVFEPEVVPSQDETYVIETRLELVEAR